MKQLLVLFAVFFIYANCSAQEDDSKVEQYCELVATPRLLSSRVTIDVDYGETRSVWRDNRLKEDNGRVKKFNSVIDALNFMAKDGWRLVNAFPVSTSSNTYIYHYVFRKSFLRSEVDQ
jgi:hypothetical protein